MVQAAALEHSRSLDQPCAAPIGLDRGGALDASLAYEQYAAKRVSLLAIFKLRLFRLDHYRQLRFLGNVPRADQCYFPVDLLMPPAQ